MSLLLLLTTAGHPGGERPELPSTLVAPYNNPNYMTVPEVYPGRPGATHPDVWDAGPRGWRGWRYWMAFTPFHGAGSLWENPSVGVSNTPEGPFSAPDGLVNPIFPNQGAAYNSDTEIIYDPDTDRIGVIWRGLAYRQPDGSVTTGREWMWIKWSSDGVTWTPEAELWPSRPMPSAGEMLSPAFVQKPDGTWFVFSCHGLRVNTAPTLMGPWDTGRWATVNGRPANSLLWHIDVIRHRGQYRALIQFKIPVPPSTTDTEYSTLVPAVSLDGYTWECGPPIMDPLYEWEGVSRRGFYRAAFLPSDNGADYDVWYSGTGASWRIGYTRVPQRLWSQIQI